MRRAHADKGYYYPYQQSNNTVEDENQGLVEGLQDKVDMMKSLSIDMGSEIRSQNKLLSEMDDDFDKAQGFLQKSMNRIQHIAKMGGHNFIWKLLGFCLFIFFLIYLIVKFR